MKIALLVHDFHRSGGHSRYVAELASRFAQDHEVHIFTNTYEPQPGLTYRHVPANRTNALTLIYTFRRNCTHMLRSEQFDVIHDQGLCCEQPDVLTAHISNRAWSRARSHAPLKEKLFGFAIGWWEQRQYARSGRVQVIAVSNRVRRDLSMDYGFHGAVSVVHHGVDAQTFAPDKRNAPLRAELGLANDAKLFLFVGDFRKGAEACIRALENGYLLCVGATPPEPYREIAKDLHREDRVHFRPATSAIEQYYAAADVLLLPTPYDAFGMVALEGMAAGLPVVVSRNAGASELIVDGTNGFVLRDSADLSELMSRAAQSNVGPAARLTALDHSWDRVAAQTLDVYRRAKQTPRILTFATQGFGGNDEARLAALTQNFVRASFPFDATQKLSSANSLFRTLLGDRPKLAVMEGTGIGGGLTLLAARLVFGQRYVVSSGDAIAPFVAQKKPWLEPFFGLYERLLCRFAAGFIGWTPYLSGRALTYGAPRAMTAAGWAPQPLRSTNGLAIRRALSIPANALVIGITGSLTWTPSVKYCYGYELARAATRTKRADIRFLIVGEGSGRAELERVSDPRVILTGFVSRDLLPDYLAAMDIASLPQSCDGVGSFRYSTKLSEYLAAGLPVVTGQIPAAYDLDCGWAWRLPGNGPWEDRYITALAALLDSLTPEQIDMRRNRVPPAPPEFDRASQIERVTAFLNDILNA